MTCILYLVLAGIPKPMSLIVATDELVSAGADAGILEKANVRVKDDLYSLSPSQIELCVGILRNFINGSRRRLKRAGGRIFVKRSARFSSEGTYAGSIMLRSLRVLTHYYLQSMSLSFVLRAEPWQKMRAASLSISRTKGVGNRIPFLQRRI